MTGAAITANQILPGEEMVNGSIMIYFSVTLDGSAKADFSGYDAVHVIYANDASTLAVEAATEE